jgi:hypothetical protein
MKPDVAAPGVNVLSSLPESQGGFGVLSGRSMAAPHVSGAAALLKERHPTWTVAEIKSALEQTGDPVLAGTGQALPLREGGGVVDLPRADNPLFFASPTGLAFKRLAPGASQSAPVSLTDAGGGAGEWAVTSVVAAGDGKIAVPATVTVPGTLPVTATAGTTTGDVSGFVILTRGADVRRIPFWFDVSAPRLASSGTRLTSPGVVHGTTKGAPSRVSVYRYPTGGDVPYNGPERTYRLRITGRPANFGAVVLSGRAIPHVVFDGSEDHLAGYAGLPIDLNPYRSQYGATIPVAGAVLPAPGTYDLVFDTRSAAAVGPFTFRWWVNDVTPPRVRILSTRGAITLSATDTGSGVDPSSLVVKLDGQTHAARYQNGRITIAATHGRHSLVVTIADYQETKNMEDVAPILPNTSTLRAAVTVR